MEISEKQHFVSDKCVSDLQDEEHDDAYIFGLFGFGFFEEGECSPG